MATSPTMPKPRTPQDWWNDPIVPRWAAFVIFMFGVLMGFSCYYRGHQLWPSVFPDAVEHEARR